MDRPDEYAERVEEREDVEDEEGRSEQYLTEHRDELESLRGQSDSYLDNLDTQDETERGAAVDESRPEAGDEDTEGDQRRSSDIW